MKTLAQQQYHSYTIEKSFIASELCLDIGKERIGKERTTSVNNGISQ